MWINTTLHLLHQLKKFSETSKILLHLSYIRQGIIFYQPDKTSQFMMLGPRKPSASLQSNCLESLANIRSHMYFNSRNLHVLILNHALSVRARGGKRRGGEGERVASAVSALSSLLSVGFGTSSVSVSVVPTGAKACVVRCVARVR